MGDKLKGAANIALGIVIFLAILSLPFIFIKGAFWASRHVLRPLIDIGWIALAVVVVVLLPLSMFRRLRGFTGIAIFIFSYVFGLIGWLFGFVVTYAFWGIWAVIIGIVFLGGGVIPIGMLASIFKGEWQTLGILTGLVVVTFGARILGAYIAEKAE